MERTRDHELIRSILANPDIYPYITDDSCPTVDKFQPIVSDSTLYLHEHGTGIFLFVHDNHASVSAHVCVYPGARGKAGISAGIDAIQWIWKNTFYQRIWSAIPAYNLRAIRYAELVGMKRFGVNEKSFMKDGILYDQILLGVSRCQQQR
jgi:hypothetical protein